MLFKEKLMPLEKCTENGKNGYRWKGGKCYTSKDAKQKALKQGAAIEINKHAKGEEADLSILSFEELLKLGLEESLKDDK